MAHLEFSDGEGAPLNAQQPEVGPPSPEREAMATPSITPPDDTDADELLGEWRRTYADELEPAVRAQVFGWFGVDRG